MRGLRHPSAARLSRNPWVPLGLALAAALTLTGCSGGDSSAAPAEISVPASDSPYRGVLLSQPVSLAGFAGSATFQSTAGGTTTLNQLQQGQVMIVGFGYTNCPDVCPMMMADLSAALRKAGPDVQQRTQVVFITADPQRDTVPAMSNWLARFDGGLATPFVGLTAPIEQLNAVASALNVALSPAEVEPDGKVTVTHGSQTLAFVDGKASLLWTTDATADDYAYDLSKLVKAN